MIIRRNGTRTLNKPKVNFGIVFLLCFILFFTYRIFSVLKENTERGSLAYVQMLNFGLPIVEETTYDETDFHESLFSFKTVLIQALGLDKLSHFGIVNNEVCFFNQGFSLSDSNLASVVINPFKLKDESISKAEPTESKVTGVYNENLKQEINHSKPRVLIYHTHTPEGYSDGDGSIDSYNTNVVGVGEELTRILEEDYGISVVHDKTNHYLDYHTCYETSGETVKEYLQKYGDFDLVIDLHRDAVPNKNATTANINNEDIAKIMFVLAGNSGRNAKNTALVDTLEAECNELFPGVLRKRTVYSRGKCGPNLGLSDGSLVVEVGSNLNTSEEAKNSAKYIARLLAEYLSGK